MALVRTDLLGQISGASGNFGTGVFTTTAFTPPSNSLLVVCVGAVENGGTTSLLTDLTLASAGLTFTSRVEQGASVTSFSTGVRVWTAPVTSGVSMTLDIDCGPRSIGMYGVSVCAYTGYDTTTPTGATGATFQDSGFAGPPTPASLTLSAAPDTSSEVLGVAGMDKSTAGATPGAAFTEIHDVSNSDWGGLESEVRASSTSTTVDWVDLRPGGGALFNYAIVGLELRAASSSVPDPGVALFATQAPGLWAPNGVPIAWAGTEDPAASATQTALPSGAVASGPAATANGTAAVTATPAAAAGGGSTATAPGAASITTSPSGAFCSSGTITATATASQIGLPSGASGSSGAQTATGTASVSTTAGPTFGAAITTTTAGTATVTTASTVSIGNGGLTFATATTLQAGSPSGATGAGATPTASGTTSVTITPSGASATGTSTSLSGTATLTVTAGGATGAGTLTTATATTLQSALPGGCGGAGQSTLSGAATVTGSPGRAVGSGSTPAFSGTASLATLPGGCTANGGASTTGIAQLAASGRAGGFGGIQAVDVQLMSRGLMGPAARSTSEMSPTTRATAGMYPVDR